MNVSEFDYDLPPELIAQYPVERRDQSRLMVVNRTDRTLTHTIFAQLVELLDPSDVLVVNDTKVIPARLQGQKRTSGGKVEVFLLRQLADPVWEVLIGGKVKPGMRIDFGGGKLFCIVQEKQADGKGIVAFDHRENLKELLFALGTVPLPPYIKRPQGALPNDADRYQTVYARREGSVAAPTAGLHFSEDLLHQIRAQGIQIVTVTLHVGIGTFQPVKVERVEDHQIMPEWYEISEQAAQQLTQALRQKQRIIAVGTTTTRLLETAYQSDQTIQAGSGWANLFIYPGFEFHVTQALITNFHLPRSSLLMLVSAFGGMELLRQAYQEAIAQRYRFYSYGDAMLIL